MEADEIPVDAAKVQEIISFLSGSVVNIPEYDTNKAKAEEEIVELGNLSLGQTMTVKERDRHNGILQDLEVPDNLFL